MSAKPNVNSRSSRGATDPAVYDQYRSEWEEVPNKEVGWIQRAKDVAAVLATDAAVRDRENKLPRAEIALLKHSRLLTILGSQQYGGGDQPWSVGYRVIREVARGDGSIGMLLGYHLLWSTIARVVGSPAQAERFEELIISNNYFLGGAVNPRDSDLNITQDGEGLVFEGFKFFNTGGVISDLTILEGSFEGTTDHIFTIVKTEQPAIVFSHDWDNIGLRGNFLAHLRAATALADRAGDELTKVYGKASSLDEKGAVTAQDRGEVAEWVASVKVVATDVGLRVTSGVFEATGAKATATKIGLDRFWRDVRTHTLHDPVAYKNRELGRYQLLGEHPAPTWYT